MSHNLFIYIVGYELHVYCLFIHNVYFLYRETLRECSTVQTRLGNELLDYYNEVEKSVLKPLSSVLEVSIMPFIIFWSILSAIQVILYVHIYQCFRIKQHFITIKQIMIVSKS